MRSDATKAVEAAQNAVVRDLLQSEFEQTRKTVLATVIKSHCAVIVFDPLIDALEAKSIASRYFFCSARASMWMCTASPIKEEAVALPKSLRLISASRENPAAFF